MDPTNAEGTCITDDLSFDSNAVASVEWSSIRCKTDLDDVSPQDKRIKVECVKSMGSDDDLKNDVCSANQGIVQESAVVDKEKTNFYNALHLERNGQHHNTDHHSADQNISADRRRPRKKRPTAEAGLQCTDCTFQAGTSEKLKLHMRSVHGEGESYACCICSFESKWNREYYNHMRSHFPGPPYQCDFEYCAAKCDRIQHLLYHRMNHTKERPYSCSCCPMRFKIKSTLIVHQRKHTGYSPFTCTECSRSFSTKGALQQHAVTHSEKRSYLCDQCGFNTKHQSHLISHRRIHAGDVLRCQLENCAYTTTKRSQMMTHMQSHLRIKTFFCDQCRQGFVAKSHLKRHQLTHIPSKPFFCDCCEYRSNRKDKLRLHVQKHHGESADTAASNRPKPRTAKVTPHAQFRESETTESDDTYAACARFQKMVQKVDEQLQQRRVSKYTKLPWIEPVTNGDHKLIVTNGNHKINITNRDHKINLTSGDQKNLDLSSTRISEISESKTADDQLVVS